MGKTPCCDKNGLKKGPWTAEEDQKLIDYIQKHGHGRWRTLPKNAGLQRCGKSCRLRWTNYLRPDIKRGKFSLEEEETIIHLHTIMGNKWSAIAARLPGRTDNEIKNYWNTHIRKRLLRMGIDPQTHGPRLDLLELSSSSSVLAPIFFQNYASSFYDEHSHFNDDDEDDDYNNNNNNNIAFDQIAHQPLSNFSYDVNLANANNTTQMPDPQQCYPNPNYHHLHPFGDNPTNQCCISEQDFQGCTTPSSSSAASSTITTATVAHSFLLSNANANLNYPMQSRDYVSEDQFFSPAHPKLSSFEDDLSHNNMSSSFFVPSYNCVTEDCGFSSVGSGGGAVPMAMPSVSYCSTAPLMNPSSMVPYGHVTEGESRSSNCGNMMFDHYP